MLTVNQLNQATVFLGRVTMHATEVPAYVELMQAIAREVDERTAQDARDKRHTVVHKDTFTPE